MTLNDLTVNFSHLDRNTILCDWEWLLDGEYLPVLLSASGDAFVQHIRNDQVWWLDTGGAEFSQVAESPEEFNELLSDKKFVVEYFAVQLIGDLIQSGKRLSSGQIYSLTKPWLLGGEYELSNLEPTDIEVHLSLSGQIAQKVVGT
ncbi:T6SS immunity protein Tdi1 domain-containing protein [Ferrimonas kyonanensis]|uniref:T6SS immunity protein Tdi1 domain-containing protein n=1 Tax=Ferrimonas kyonanensis TaxID=364763 RepID=UPI000A057114|nr:T6SS immunity protein Tdi1 domain-containing protein [Ferrimonas kyonanensis]